MTPPMPRGFFGGPWPSCGSFGSLSVICFSCRRLTQSIRVSPPHGNPRLRGDRRNDSYIGGARRLAVARLPSRLPPRRTGERLAKQDRSQRGRMPANENLRTASQERRHGQAAKPLSCERRQAQDQAAANHAARHRRPLPSQAWRPRTCCPKAKCPTKSCFSTPLQGITYGSAASELRP